jgi:predicted nucleotidyltransferase
MESSIIKSLFENAPQAKLIQWLYVDAKPTEQFSGRELARLAKVPYGSVDRALKSLVRRQLVVREEGKHGPEYHAPFEDPRLRALFILLRQDSNIVRLLKRALKPFKSIDYAAVFGSFARGTTTAKSDIDVLVLESSDSERFEVMAALSKVTEKIGREVNTQFYRNSEFRNLVLDNEPIAVQILNGPRIDLKGKLEWH